MCIPLRAHGELQGYLWLIDSPPLSEADIATANDTAADIAEVLYRQSLSTATALDQETTLVGALLHPHGVEPKPELLREQPLLAFTTPLTVVTTRLSPSEGSEPLTFATIRSAMQEVIYARPTGRSLLGHNDDAIHLIGSTDVPDDRLRPFRHALGRAAQRRGWMLYGTGTGSAATSLTQLPRSGEESAYAATMAHTRRVEHLAWAQLGADIAFFGLPWTTDTLEILFPGAARLLEPENRLIRESLDAYFDCGGDTRLAAAQLAIHRTTLYYRLDRAKELLGKDWHHGERRYGLQSALRLAQLIRKI